METIDAAEAHRLFREEGVRIIDVREPAEWDQVRVPGTKLEPLSDIDGDPTRLAPAKKTIFMCAKGFRSMIAAELYESAWPGETFNLDGGIVAWQEAGYEVEQGKV